MYGSGGAPISSAIKRSMSSFQRARGYQADIIADVVGATTAHMHISATRKNAARTAIGTIHLFVDVLLRQATKSTIRNIPRRADATPSPESALFHQKQKVHFKLSPMMDEYPNLGVASGRLIQSYPQEKELGVTWRSSLMAKLSGLQTKSHSFPCPAKSVCKKVNSYTCRPPMAIARRLNTRRSLESAFVHACCNKYSDTGLSMFFFFFSFFFNCLM